MSREQVAPARDGAAVVLFDGVCNLCSGLVRFVIRHDRSARFRFASLQSPPAERLLSTHGWREPDLSSVILLVDGQVYSRSRAVLEILRRLDEPWPVLYVLRLVPRGISDWLYDLIGARRYRWFGMRGECWIPSGESSCRFLV